MNRTILGATLSLSLVLLSLFSSSTAQQAQSLKLPSGRVIKVLGVGRIDFPQSPTALMLKYQTDLKASDTIALRKEADEIWAVFKADVEKQSFKAAILSASEKPTGNFLQKSNGYNFVYERAADGRWHCLDDDKGKWSESQRLPPTGVTSLQHVLTAGAGCLRCRRS